MMNVLNGGAHADNNVDFQEFMIVPVGAASFSEALRWGAEVFHALKVLHDAGLSTAVGDEGGFAPTSAPTRRRSISSWRGIEAAGYTPGEDVALALDVAPASSTRTGPTSSPARANASPAPRWSTTGPTWCDRYPIVSIEDGMAEDDWDGWERSPSARRRVQLVGDDLFVTNPERLGEGHRGGVANSILVKVNQIGTLTETLEAVAGHRARATPR